MIDSLQTGCGKLHESKVQLWCTRLADRRNRLANEIIAVALLIAQQKKNIHLSFFRIQQMESICNYCSTRLGRALLDAANYECAHRR